MKKPTIKEIIWLGLLVGLIVIEHNGHEKIAFITAVLLLAWVYP